MYFSQFFLSLFVAMKIIIVQYIISLENLESLVKLLYPFPVVFPVKLKGNNNISLLTVIFLIQNLYELSPIC